MIPDEEKIEEMIKKAADLTKVLGNMEQIMDGLPYSDRISLISTMLMKNIVQEHETSIEVVADMATIFTTMVQSYRLMNDLSDDDDDDDEDESLPQ